MQIRDQANILKFPGMQNFCWKIIAIFFLVFIYIALVLHSLCWSERDHFETHFSLCFKASLSEKSLLWISVFIHIENRANYRNKTWDWLNKSTWNKGMILLKSKQNLKYFYSFLFFSMYVTAFVCLSVSCAVFAADISIQRKNIPSSNWPRGTRMGYSNPGI